MSNITGPLGYRNWRNFKPTSAVKQEFELPLYSDAEIVGGMVFDSEAPYYIMNSGGSSAGGLRPALYLRVKQCEELPALDRGRTDDSNFHGGSLPEELAALLSLILGVRLKAGSSSRRFDDHDPLGTPLADHNPPSLLPSYRGAPVIPAALRGDLDADALRYFRLYPQAKPEHALALIRAARSYRDGLWISDAEPELSWLLFTSAIEAVAVTDQGDNYDVVDLLTSAFKTLPTELDAACASQAIPIVARHLSRQLRATARFLDFLEKFAPTSKSPLCTGKAIDWSKRSLRQAFSRVYGYRSAALHEAKPFPSPMCGAPLNGNEAPESFWTRDNGYWAPEDTPMLLHTFGYITRMTILNWWQAAVVSWESGPTQP